MNRLIVSFILALCCVFCGAAQTYSSFPQDVMAISFDDGSGVNTKDGTGKAEHYDVAMYLDDAGLAGKSIVGVRIPFDSTEDISGLNVWAASALELSEDKLPVCDLAQLSVDPVEGWTEVLFPSPLTLSGNGIFLGYSFDVDKINGNNLKPVCLTSIVSQDGYFIHTGRTAKYKQGWTNVNEGSDVGSLRMQVMVEGMDANAAAIEIYSRINVQLDEVAYAPVRVICHGYNGVSSIDYEYDINGTKAEGSYIFNTPIAAVYNKYADVDLPLCKVTEQGQLPLSIKVVKVNGEENTDLGCMSEGSLNVFDFVPVHRPLFEEYTGTWCGNCPRGLAGIEAMKELYPDDFICISYHNADAMEITSSFPSEIRGFPDSWIDRVKCTDPFYGDKSDGQFHLVDEWEKIKKEPANVSVNIEADWNDEDESAIKVDVRIISQIHYSPEDLAIGCALIADDLSGNGSSWWQHNYYAGQSESCAPELKWIAEYPSVIKNFHFNDVLVLGKNLDGSEANLPFEIEPMTEYETSFILPLEEAVNTSGTSLIQDKSKLKVVAFCVDRNSAEIRNANQTGYLTSSAVDKIYSDSSVARVEYYDLFGNRTDPSARGILLKVTYLNNGTIQCSKTVVK